MKRRTNFTYTPKILHLTLKKKWFDLIASGRKIYEYRENKEYWEKRLLDDNGESIKFEEVHFKNGYGKDVPFMRVVWKELVRVPPFWKTAHGEIVNPGDFVICLGDVLERR